MSTPCEMKAKEELFNDAVRGKWDGVVERYRDGRVAQHIRITRTGDTVLHLAVSNGDADVVEKLVAAVDPADTGEILCIGNGRGDTPLHLAASLGMKRMCRVIARRRLNLILDACNFNGETPLFVAARHGQIRTFLELHHMSRPMANSCSHRNYCQRSNGDTILHCAIAGEHFELALQIINLNEDLVNVKNYKGQTALHLLAGMPHAFKSGSHIQLFDRFIYERDIDIGRSSNTNHELKEIRTEEPENSLEIVTEEAAEEKKEQEHLTPRNKYVRRPPGSYDQILKKVAGWSIFLIIFAFTTLLVLLGVVGIKGILRLYIIRERKQKHMYAFQIMEELVERSTPVKYEDMRRLDSPDTTTFEDTPILIAAKNGVKEVVKKIVDTYPVAVQDVDAEGKNVVLLAAEHRRPGVYKLMLKRITVRDTVFGITDDKGNNALHLAATLTNNSRPWNIPGAALQMQWEIKWYKFIQRSLDNDIFPSLNVNEQSTKRIFSDQHQELIKEGSKWLTNTSQSCSVVAALIAAVAFSSISTVPGGTDQNHGTPLLQHEVAFKIFAISSLVALCSSVTSLVMFLSVLTSRFNEADFEEDLPRKLIRGLTLIFLSIAAMLVAFCSAHFFAVARKLHYIAYTIYAVFCIPTTYFAIAHFRLYIDLITAINSL